jgi:hypothetical protein
MTEDRTATGGWIVDIDELAEVIDAIGLSTPVSIAYEDTLGPSLHNPQDECPGYYTGVEDGKHRISLLRGLKPAVASWSLLHELIHAAQYEEHGRDWLLSNRDEAERDADERADYWARRYAPITKLQP